MPKTLTAAERAGTPLRDFADPAHRKYPIRDQEEADAVGKLWGRSEDEPPAEVKRNAIRIIKRRKLKLPKEWESDPDAKAKMSAPLRPDIAAFKSEDLSDQQVRNMIGAAVSDMADDAGWGSWSCYVVDVNRLKGFCTYQRCSGGGDADGLYKCDFDIDDDYTVVLGESVKVVAVPNYEPAPATFSLGAQPIEENGFRIYENSLLFRAGSYPDKRFTMTEEDIRNCCAAFDGASSGAGSSADVNFEHAPAMLNGKLGHVRKLFTDDNGRTLRGVVAIPTWLDDQLTDEERRVSAEFDRNAKTFSGLALTRTPRVQDAALMAAFSAANPSTPPAGGTNRRPPTAAERGKEQRTMPNPFKRALQQAAALFSGAAAEIPDDDPGTGTGAGAGTGDAPPATAAATFTDTDRTAMQQRIAELEQRDIERNAVAFADSAIADKRALPAERGALIAQFTQAAKDDAAAPAKVAFTVGTETRTGNRVDALRAHMAARPQHALFSEVVPSGENGERLVLMAASNDDDKDGADDEEVKRMLGKTTLGKKALAAKNGKDK